MPGCRLNCHPDHPAAVHLLGIIVGRLGRTAESVQLLRHAVQLQPRSAQAHHNLAFALRIDGSLDEAIAQFNRAIQISPDFAEAHNNLGIAWKDKLRLPEATACYSKAIQIKPDFADAHWNLALVLLMGGDFEHGLAEYEWRRKIKSMWTAPAFSQPQWSGEDLGGRTILLFPEQGSGDAIQFARYVPLVARRGGRVILTCRPELARLFQRLPGGAKVVINGQPIPPFDVQCSLVGLPRVFATDLNSIPAATPYLSADPALVEKWSQRLSPTDGRLRAGLAWAGNPAHQNDRNRSIQPQQLFPLTELSHVALYSLQKENSANQSPPPMKLIDFTSEMSDFADTAALIVNLDLVVTVDTAVAHLAAALGKPTWVLLPFVPDWRWLLDRQDSPWYPTMRLFRQPSGGQWGPIIDSIAVQLAKYVSARPLAHRRQRQIVQLKRNRELLLLQGPFPSELGRGVLRLLKGEDDHHPFGQLPGNIVLTQNNFALVIDQLGGADEIQILRVVHRDPADHQRQLIIHIGLRTTRDGEGCRAVFPGGVVCSGDVVDFKNSTAGLCGNIDLAAEAGNFVSRAGDFVEIGLKRPQRLPHATLHHDSGEEPAIGPGRHE